MSSSVSLFTLLVICCSLCVVCHATHASTNNVQLTMKMTHDIGTVADATAKAAFISAFNTAIANSAGIAVERITNTNVDVSNGFVVGFTIVGDVSSPVTLGYVVVSLQLQYRDASSLLRTTAVTSTVDTTTALIYVYTCNGIASGTTACVESTSANSYPAAPHSDMVTSHWWGIVLIAAAGFFLICIVFFLAHRRGANTAETNLDTMKSMEMGEIRHTNQ